MKKLHDFTLLNLLKNLFAKPNTILYPNEKKLISVLFRGEPMLRFKQDGSERCNGCKKCEKICPVKAIKIESETIDGKRRINNFTIDLNKCIFCGKCEEICQENALMFSTNFEYAKFNKKELAYTKAKLLRNGERWEYIARLRDREKEDEKE